MLPVLMGVSAFICGDEETLVGDITLWTSRDGEIVFGKGGCNRSKLDFLLCQFK
jgi:hypothetical protein